MLALKTDENANRETKHLFKDLQEPALVCSLYVTGHQLIKVR
jgi:hypothetical protein